jgi:hypothetical protein
LLALLLLLLLHQVCPIYEAPPHHLDAVSG